MNQNSLNWGIGITVIWLAVIVAFWVFGGLQSPTSLNELGDFLAGVFAPVAFLWLILGYVQQGKQLDQNTKALEQQEKALQLQIDEMKESVKQQTELANIQSEELLALYKGVKPSFDMIVIKIEVLDESDNYGYKVFVKLRNRGKGDAKEIHFLMEDCRFLLYWYSLKQDEDVGVNFKLLRREVDIKASGNGLEASFHISYECIYDHKYKQNFRISMDSLSEEDGLIRKANIYPVR